MRLSLQRFCSLFPDEIILARYGKRKKKHHLHQRFLVISGQAAIRPRRGVASLRSRYEIYAIPSRYFQKLTPHLPNHQASMFSYPTPDFAILALSCSGLILLRIRKPFKLLWLITFMSIYHMRVDNHDSCVINALQACNYIIPHCAVKTDTCEEFHGWNGLVDEEGYLAHCGSE